MYANGISGFPILKNLNFKITAICVRSNKDGRNEYMGCQVLYYEYSGVKEEQVNIPLLPFPSQHIFPLWYEMDKENLKTEQMIIEFICVLE